MQAITPLRHERLQDLLLQISSSLITVSAKDRDGVLNHGLAAVGEFEGVDRAYLFDYNHERDICINTYEWCAEGISREKDKLQAVPLSEIPEWVAAHRQGRIVSITDVAAMTDNTGLRAVLTSQGIVSVLSVPLMDGDQCLGFIGFDSVRQRRAYTDEEQRLLRLLANMLVHVYRRLEAEANLNASEKRFLDVMYKSEQAIALIDENRFVDCNLASARALGYATREEILCVDRSVVTPPTQPDGADSSRLAAEMERLAFVKGFHRFTYWKRHADGHDFPADISLTPVVFRGRNMLYCVWRDISREKQAEAELNRLQAQLYQAQKMEVIGRLAGGIAHDYNNMLGVMLGHLEMAMLRVGPGNPLRDDLREIQQAAEHSAALTRQLLGFARKQAMTPRVLDVNENVASLLTMLGRLVGKTIQMVWKPDPAAGPVFIDPVQLEQILSNLIVNARDALDGKGLIEVATKNLLVDEALTGLPVDAAPGSYVVIVVRDHGCGMNEQLLGHLFEPFFTTKEPGKGTGLGLSTVYGIVRQNQGFITVASAPGKGTTFQVHLPRHTAVGMDQAAPRAPAQGTTSGADDTKPLVLLVDDEPGVLKLTAKLLDKLGYRVLAAATPEIAMEIANRDDIRLNLLVLDVMLPNMSGFTLAAKLKERHPGARQLYISGYTNDLVDRQSMGEAPPKCLQKPFSHRELERAVQSALADV